MDPRDIVSDWSSVDEHRLGRIDEGDGSSTTSKSTDHTFVTRKTGASLEERFRREPTRPTDVGHLELEGLVGDSYVESLSGYGIMLETLPGKGTFWRP